MFKPAGQPVASLEEVALTLEEYEAIRLADFEALYQEDAAKRMGVSRQTFGRTIAQARGKVARALVLGCVLRIEAAEARGSPERQAGHARFSLQGLRPRLAGALRHRQARGLPRLQGRRFSSQGLHRERFLLRPCGTDRQTINPFWREP